MMLRFAFILSFTALTTPAFADAIDGDWCLGAKRLSIKGPAITLPSGVAIQGKYGRHEFIYQVPAGDPDAGDLRYLQLQGDDFMSLYHVKNGKAVDGESWMRCKPDATS